MNIDKFKKDDGYYDEDECYYEDAESFLQCAVFKFCGCGCPESSLAYIHSALNQVQRLKDEVWEDKMTWTEWDKENKELLGGENGVWFMWYFLDREGFTEHGGSVPGWLTDKGVEMLQDLTELLASEKDDPA